MKLEQAAASVPGVDPGSMRLSLELASLAIAFDPRRTTLAQVHSRLERKLRPLGLSLLPMRLMDRPADLIPLNTAGAARRTM
jgi:hypothetical protein